MSLGRLVLRRSLQMRSASFVGRYSSLRSFSGGQQRVVLAIGGNALQSSTDKGTADEMIRNVKVAAQDISRLIASGHRVTIVHGNGPQVGALFLQQQMCAESIPPLPLNMCVASSQGHIGQLLQQHIGNALLHQSSSTPKVLTVASQVQVESDDPAFESPSKPVGKFYTESEALALSKETGASVMEDSGRGWRVCVASPRPTRIVEAEAIALLRDSGYTVIAGGGGGVAVVRGSDGTFESRDAVIDKDLVAEKLADEIGADALVIATDVKHVYTNFATDKTPITKATVKEMEKHVADGHFAKGSMSPKVDAAIAFTKATQKPTIICALSEIEAAMNGDAGTTIVA